MDRTAAVAPVVAKTERLVLRRFMASDVEAMERVFGDPEVMRFGPGVQTRDWVVDWLARCASDYERFGYCRWAVEESSRGEVIGYCGPMFFPNLDGRSEVELGYRLCRPFWGKGYATEAALAARDHAFFELGLRRLIAFVDPNNTASVRVAEKLGMLHEGDAPLEGYSYPDRVYAIERDAR